MELKDIYKNGARCKTKNFGTINVVNDESQFKLYQKMGLDVFKTDEDREQEKIETKLIKDLEKKEVERLKDRAKYQKDKKAKADKIEKSLKNAEKISKEKKED